MSEGATVGDGLADGAGPGGQGAGDVAPLGHGERVGPARCKLSRSDDAADCGRVRSERQRTKFPGPLRQQVSSQRAGECERMSAAAAMKEREHAEDAVKKGNETDGSSAKADIRKTDIVIDYSSEQRTGRDSYIV